MRTTIYGKEITTKRTYHIDEVLKKQKQTFICNECGNTLIPVKTDARGKDWHFRHTVDSDLLKCRQTGLHDFVQQLLLEKSSITIAAGRRIEFEEPKKEQWIEKLFRSDVCVVFECNFLHFEIVVTHDLSEKKISYFIQKNIRCVRIDLSDKEYLNMSRDTIIDLVLNKWENKTMYGWGVIDLEETIICQAIDPAPECVIQSKEPVFYTTSSQKDPVITFLKWLLVVALAYIFYKLIFNKKARYVAINRKSNNRYRRY